MPTLAQSRRHVAIIGKFTSEQLTKNHAPVVKTTFAEAGSHLALQVYAGPSTTFVNDQPFETLSFFTANNVPGRIDDRSFYSAISISGTPLKKLFDDELSDDPETLRKFGALAFVELLDLLDKQLPFSHPNFDLILTDSLFRFISLNLSGKRLFTPETLLKLLYDPDVNTLLLAWLRSPRKERERQQQRFTQRVLRMTKDFGVGIDNDSAAVIVGQIASFLGALDTTSDLDPLVVLNSDERCRQLLATAPLPGIIVPTGTAANKLRELYRLFQDLEEKLTALADCEPLFSLIVSWGLVLPCNNREMPGAELNTLFYEKSPFSAFSDATLRAMTDIVQDEFGKAVNDEKDPSHRTVLEVQRDAAVLGHKDAYERRRSLDAKDVIRRLAEIFGEISAKLIEGMGDNIEEINRFIRSSFDQFQTLAKLKANKARPKQAIEKLLESKWMDGAFAAGEKDSQLTPDEFYEEMARRYARWEATRLKEIAGGFRAQSADEIQQFIPAIKRRATEALKQLRPEDDSKLSTAAPGASANGVSRSAAADAVQEVLGADEASRQTLLKVETEARKQEERRLRAGAGKPESGKADPLPNRDAAGAQADPQQGSGATGAQTDPQHGSGANGAHTDPQETAGPDAGRPKHGGELFDPGELMAPEVEIRFEEIRRKIYDELNVLDQKNEGLAPDRARLRAYLFGQYLLSRADNLLGKKDRSLSASVVLKMIEKVGATAAWEKNRKNLVQATADVETGIKNIGLDALVQFDGTRAEEAISEYIVQWMSQAKDLVRLRDDLKDAAAIKTLLDRLAKCGDGVVTLYNQSLSEHAALDPAASVFGARIPAGIANKAQSENAVPAVVVVSSLAFTRDAGTRAIDPLWAPLCEKPESPLRPKDSASRIRGLEPFEDATFWGMPLFLGRRISCASANQLPPLPHLSLDVPDYLDAVLPLVGGGKTGDAWIKGQREIDERSAEFANRVTSFGGTDELGKGTLLYAAWAKVLTAPKALAPQVVAKLLTAALAERVKGGSALEQQKLWAEAALSLIKEIEALYGKNTLEEALWVKSGVRLPRVKNQIADLEPALIIGGQGGEDARIAEWIGKV